MGKIGDKKIAIVHDFVFMMGGAEKVLQSLVRLFPGAPVYTAFYNKELVAKEFPGVKFISSSLQGKSKYIRPSFLVNQIPSAIEELDFKDFDIVVSSSGAFSHGIITGPETTHICYCHTPMRYVWDYHSEYLDEKGIRNPYLRFLAESKINKLREWDFVASKRVDVWLANSMNVQNRIQKYYGQQSEVVYPPVEVNYLIEQSRDIDLENENSRYLISLGRLTKNKNIDLIIKACAKLKYKLILVGEGRERNNLEKLTRSLDADVIFAGRVDEPEKIRLLTNADAFVFAAEDDFGMAPVEALACGIPVVAYGRGGASEYVLPEINGSFFDELEVDKVIEAIQAMTNLTTSKIRIQNSVSKFDSSIFDQEILKSVEKAC